MPPKSTVVVPLYIYPLTAESWAPLYAAIEANPSLNFLVIVNPNSGPGDTPLPDENYTREVSRLNSYANVQTVGYIRIDYCRRPLDESLAEIARYAGWSEQVEARGLGVRGIFVDETPNHHSVERADYLSALTRAIKKSKGILGEKFVVHNPGTAPDALLAAASGAELTFVCEEPYHRYRSEEVQHWLGLHPFFDRSQAGYMISGVPADQVHDLVLELRHRSAFFFVTEIREDFYECFGRTWMEFMRALQADE